MIDYLHEAACLFATGLYATGMGLLMLSPAWLLAVLLWWALP